MSGSEARWNAARALLLQRRNDPPLLPVPRDGDPPASFAQERLWFLARLQPDSTAYQLAVACRMRGTLEVAALERSVAELWRRHEILRTTLRMVDGTLLQRIDAASAPSLGVEDVRARDLSSWTARHANERFDLERGPLVRVRLGRLAAQDHCLVVTAHHALLDGWSFETFMHELSALYDAERCGRASPLPPPVLQYADFASWQRRQLLGARPALLDFWTRQLHGELPLLRLPVDRERRARARRKAQSQTMTLPHELTAALKALAASEGATLYTVLLAAFSALLHRYSGDSDVIVGSPVAGRAHAQLGGVIGMFVNTLALRVDLDGDPTFRQLLVRVRDTATAALAHQDLPFEELVAALALPRHADRMPLYDVLLALQNVPRARRRWSDLDVEATNVPSSDAKLDLALTMQESDGGLAALAEYDAELFDASTIARMLGHFAALLDAVARDADRAIAALPLLSPDETRVVAGHNATARDYPRDQAVHRLFEAEVRRAPEAIAVVGCDESLSYAELNRRANRLARRLVALSLPPESLVGVCIERSPSLIAAQLAILKAGYAYLPIDPEAPRQYAAERLRHASFVVTDEACRAATLARERDDDLDVAVDAERLAYVMFTSGSTGRPRGVCVPHRGIVRLVRGASYARFGADEVFLQLAPAAFDASTFEVWGALLNGGRLVLAPPHRLSIDEIATLVRRQRVTTLWLTSGLFELLVDSGFDAPPSLRQLLTGGDVMSPRHAEAFLRRAPGCRLINCYGPTENTTFSCTYAVDRVESGRSIPIGRPIANSTCHVLDAHLQPVPVGVVGEAYVGGDGLARGYLDDEAATRERFVADPFAAGERLYRTGDRARRRADGSLEFVGRVDDQVKLRGFRVEPAEVARAVRACAGVRAAAVVCLDRAPRDKRLVAYVVAERRDDALSARLLSALRATLPAFMVPSRIVLVDALPLTDGGKLDRRALPPPDWNATTPPAPPRDAVEERLVRLFARALDVDSVGIHDSFFDLGGDSLSAMRLIVEIEADRGRELPLSTLFQQPTVAQLAAELRRRAANAIGPGSSLVLVKDGSTPTPLFLMAGGRGTRSELSLYAKLTGKLAADETVWGLTVPGQGTTVEEFAAHCITDLRRLQPRGPYRIGGECVGGTVAYEIAQQLRASGEPVSLLLLMDSWCPSGIGVMHHRFFEQPLELARLGLSFLADVPRRGPHAEPWLAELWRRAIVPPDGKRYIRACMRYRPRPYPGRITLLASETNVRRGIARAWERLAAGGVTIHSAPGNHDNYSRTHAAETAERLRACLEERRV